MRPKALDSTGPRGRENTAADTNGEASSFPHPWDLPFRSLSVATNPETETNNTPFERRFFKNIFMKENADCSCSKFKIEACKHNRALAGSPGTVTY